ncbi:MAG: GNAT family N-acetyltransferase [Candidatus Bathyarchaeia archaeon]
MSDTQPRGGHEVERQVVIRNARDADMDRVYTIENASIRELTPLTELSSYYRIQPELFFVAEVEGVIAGFSVTVLNPNPPYHGNGHLLSIAVDPEYRRQGIGRALIKRSMEVLEYNGVGKLFLEVKESNLGGQEFYSRLGFRRLGLWRRHYPDGGNAIRLVKNVRG